MLSQKLDFLVYRQIFNIQTEIELETEQTLAYPDWWGSSSGLAKQNNLEYK
jgi:hypothetical protein